MSNIKPTRKIGVMTTAIALSTAVVTVLAWVLREFAGIQLDGEVQGALTVIVNVFVGYLVPSQATGKHAAAGREE